MLNHAITDGYRSLLPSGSYPFAIVMLDIDPTRVDVNVHPTKQEVRFDNSGAVHDFVKMAVRKAVQRTSLVASRSSLVDGEEALVPSFSSSTPSPLVACLAAGSARRGEGRGEGVVIARAGDSSLCSEQAPQSPANFPLLCKEGEGEVETLPPLDPPYKGGEVNFDTSTLRHFGILKVIGQLAGTYILCEGEGGKLIIIDQHAAHERIGFEKLKAQLSKSGCPTSVGESSPAKAGHPKVECQQLLIPEQVELQPKEAAHITEYIEALNKVGLEIEPFGGNTFVIKAVPALLADSDVKLLVATLDRELSEIGASSSTEELTERILKTMACHRQVRAGQRLSEPEMRSLLNQIDQWPNTDR